MKPVKSPAEAAALIPDGATLSISSSSGLGCPDAVLKAIGERFEERGLPRGLTVISPIAAGDMYGIKGVDHLAQRGLLKRIIAGSYPSGPSSMPSPRIWEMIYADEVEAYNIPSGILFHLHRELSAKRPGLLTHVGMDTYLDPCQHGGRMNGVTPDGVVRRVEFEGQTWLFFPVIPVDVAIIRGTSADEDGNLSMEHEGAYLGAYDQALAAHNSGGVVIAQVKRVVEKGSLNPQMVRVPGILVDYVTVDPEQMQTTQTSFDPAISGAIKRPAGSFEDVPWRRRQDDRAAGGAGTKKGRGRELGLRDFGPGAAHPLRSGRGGRGHLGDRAGGGGRACRCSAFSSAAPPTPRPSCPRPTSSAISRAAVLTEPCCPLCRWTLRATSTSRGSTPNRT